MKRLCILTGLALLTLGAVIAPPARAGERCDDSVRIYQGYDTRPIIPRGSYVVPHDPYNTGGRYRIYDQGYNNGRCSGSQSYDGGQYRRVNRDYNGGRYRRAYRNSNGSRYRPVYRVYDNGSYRRARKRNYGNNGYSRTADTYYAGGYDSGRRYSSRRAARQERYRQRLAAQNAREYEAASRSARAQRRWERRAARQQAGFGVRGYGSGRRAAERYTPVRYW